MADDKCPHEQVASSVDRIAEAAFHVYQMELAYHSADPFRWSLNCFLRSLKEVPQIIRMELQNYSGFTEWFRPKFEAIRSDPLISFLGKQRDAVVHKGMLKPASSATIGITEGRGIKLGVGGIDIDPLEDSDSAIRAYVAGTSDPLGILQDDEDSLPCVQRQWKLANFPDTELTDLATKAWEQLAGLVSDTIVWLGGDELPRDLGRHPRHQVEIKSYNRAALQQLASELQPTTDGSDSPF